MAKAPTQGEFSGTDLSPRELAAANEKLAVHTEKQEEIDLKNMGAPELEEHILADMNKFADEIQQVTASEQEGDMAKLAQKLADLIHDKYFPLVDRDGQSRAELVRSILVIRRQTPGLYNSEGKYKLLEKIIDRLDRIEQEVAQEKNKSEGANLEQSGESEAETPQGSSETDQEPEK